MKRFLLMLPIFIASLAFSSHAFAVQPVQHTKSWNVTPILNGPACNFGWGAIANVCSIDPPDPDHNFNHPCYESYYVGYVPDELETDSIHLCWAAKQVLIAPPQVRLAIMAIIFGWYNKLLAAVEADPDDVIVLTDSDGILNDMNNLQGDYEIYDAHPTDANWQIAVKDLTDLAYSTYIVNSRQ